MITYRVLMRMNNKTGVIVAWSKKESKCIKYIQATLHQANTDIFCIQAVETDDDWMDNHENLKFELIKDKGFVCTNVEWDIIYDDLKRDEYTIVNNMQAVNGLLGQPNNSLFIQSISSLFNIEEDENNNAKFRGMTKLAKIRYIATHWLLNNEGTIQSFESRYKGVSAFVKSKKEYDEMNEMFHNRLALDYT